MEKIENAGDRSWFSTDDGRSRVRASAIVRIEVEGRLIRRTTLSSGEAHRGAQNGEQRWRSISVPEVLLDTRDPKVALLPTRRGDRACRRTASTTAVYHPRHYGDPVEEYWQLLNGGHARRTSASSARWRSPGPTRSRSRTCSSRATCNKCAVGQCKYVFHQRRQGLRHHQRPRAAPTGRESLLDLGRRQRCAPGAMGIAYNSGLDVTIGTSNNFSRLSTQNRSGRPRPSRPADLRDRLTWRRSRRYSSRP